MPRPRHRNKPIIRLSSHLSRSSLCFDSKSVVVVVIGLKPGFHYTANAITATQKQSDYKVEQSSFKLIALSWLEIGSCRGRNWLKLGFHYTANATTMTRL